MDEDGQGGRRCMGEKEPMKLKPEVKVGKRQMNVSLPEDVAGSLDLYREALGADTTLNYVITEIVRGHLDGDKEFQKWLNDRQAKGNKAATTPATTTPVASTQAAPQGASSNPTGGTGANGRAHASA